MQLKIKQIKTGQRIRDDYGDMEALGKSIEEHGLLHPIVVDGDYNLIAGGRRLLACERIGWTEIEVKVLEDISERELRVLELEENIQRKDLNELERSKNLVELAEIKERELKEALPKKCVDKNWTDSVHLNNPCRIGDRKVAEEIGIPRQTLRDAKQHVAAVEEFPPLADLPKHEAIITAKELRQATPEEQEKILDFAERKTQTLSAQKESDFNSYIDECGKVTNKFITFMYSLAKLDVSDERLKMWGELLRSNQDSVSDYLQFTGDAIPKLIKIQKFLKGVSDGKRSNFK